MAHHLYRKYEQAGIQEFTHKAHTAYACNGPYIKTWEAGAASWHPSIVAHRMRAAHFSYFWLQSFNDALSKLSTILLTRSVEAAHHDVLNKLNSFYHPLTEADIPSPFQDNTTCYTDYEPREIRESSLKKIVISGLKSESGEGKGWGYSIYEDLVDKKIVEKAKSQGYLDFKYLLWGNKESGPLSLGFTTSRPGKVL